MKKIAKNNDDKYSYSVMLERQLFLPKGNKDAAAEISVKEIIDTILRKAVTSKASRIYIQSATTEAYYQLEKDRVKRSRCVINLGKNSYRALEGGLKALAGVAITHRRSPQSGTLTYTKDNEEYTFALFSFPTINGEHFLLKSLRMIPLLRYENAEQISALVSKIKHQGQGLLIISKKDRLPQHFYSDMLTSLSMEEERICNIHTDHKKLAFLATSHSDISHMYMDVDAGLSWSLAVLIGCRMEADIVVMNSVPQEELQAILDRYYELEKTFLIVITDLPSADAVDLLENFKRGVFRFHYTNTPVVVTIGEKR